MGFSITDKKYIVAQTISLRNTLEKKYGMHKGAMMGKCIEASDVLAAKLKQQGYNANAKQVWVLYQNFESCSDYCYEEHWIVEVTKGKDKVYIDTTLDQFQYFFDEIELPTVFIHNRLATFMLSRKPGRETLRKCGWTDWYNTGDYINNFEYILYVGKDR